MKKNKESETKVTRYFVERDRNRRKMAKNKTIMKQTDFRGKKSRKRKRPNKKNHERRRKTRKNDKWWRQYKKSKEEKKTRG